MSKPITPAQLRKKLVSAIENETKSITTFTGNRNPQVMELLYKAQGRRCAFEAALEALQGDQFLLNIFSRKE